VKPGNLTELKDSFAKLEQAWPVDAPPEKLVLPVTKRQALVSTIELQLNQQQ
jgi:hypothetical protein